MTSRFPPPTLPRRRVLTLVQDDPGPVTTASLLLERTEPIKPLPLSRAPSEITSRLPLPELPRVKFCSTRQNEPGPVTTISLLLLEELAPIVANLVSSLAPLVTTTRLLLPDWPTTISCRLLQTEPAPVTSAVLLLLNAPKPRKALLLTMRAAFVTTNRFRAPLLPR